MKLVLFFTFGVSAKQWSKQGLLDREKILYEQLLKSGAVDKICWITYGTADKEIEKELEQGIEIIPMPGIFNSRIGMYLYSFLIPLIHYGSLKEMDILKTNQMSGSWAAVLTRGLHKKKLIVRTGYTLSRDVYKNNYSDLKIFLAKFIERLSYSFSDGIITSSHSGLTYIKERYKLSGIETVIPNYVDANLFRPLQNISKKKNSICFVGRLSREKNLSALLEAISGLECSLTIIGSGNLESELRSLADRHNINVSFVGSVANNKLPSILNEHELFILPSLYEGMPKALLEAMSCAMPCIGTDVQGINDLIDHGKNGYLCSTDPQAIRSAISDAFNDREKREAVGQNARDKVLRNFSIDKILEKEAGLYRELLN